MFKKILLVFVILIMVGCNCTANAKGLDLTSGVIGYGVAKIGSNGQTIVQQTKEVLDYLPYRCGMNSQGTCGHGKGAKTYAQACATINPLYEPKGFIPIDRNYSLILCSNN